MKTLHLLLAASCAATPVLGLDLASSTASSASSAGSASLGSASDSLRSSSQSSAGPRQMASGDYRVVAVADVPDHPADVRLTLRAEAAADANTPARPAGPDLRWELRLPRFIAEAEGLVQGQRVRATQQPYGVSFAVAQQPRPFFLVLDSEWQQELPARPVRASAGA